MSFVEGLLSLIADLWAFFWYALLGPIANDPDAEKQRRPEQEHKSAAAAPKIDEGVAELDADPARPALERTDAARHLGRHADAGQDDEEEDVSDSFLQQLEQRTQQVKITLANLEAEKVRIEGLIAKLQPIVPQYDALLESERALDEAQVQLETAQPAAEHHEETWEQQHSPQTEHSWNG